MKKIINLLIVTLILLSGYIYIVFSAHADFMIYDDAMNYANAKCKAGEKLIECNIVTKEPYGSRVVDECKKYANHTNYYLLVSACCHSFGGSEKYCLKAGARDFSTYYNFFLEKDYVVIGGIVIVVIIMSFIILFLIRKRNINR